MKVIVCNTPEGQYAIPLQLVAEHMARHYNNGNTSTGVEWDKDIKYIMNDNIEGIYWIKNNTSWDQWVDVAKKVNGEVRVLRKDFWTNSNEFEIVELDFEALKGYEGGHVSISKQEYDLMKKKVDEFDLLSEDKHLTLILVLSSVFKKVYKSHEDLNKICSKTHIVVSKDHYDGLRERDNELARLETNGVEKWEGYSL